MINTWPEEQQRTLSLRVSKAETSLQKHCQGSRDNYIWVVGNDTVWFRHCFSKVLKLFIHTSGIFHAAELTCFLPVSENLCAGVCAHSDGHLDRALACHLSTSHVQTDLGACQACYSHRLGCVSSVFRARRCVVRLVSGLSASQGNVTLLWPQLVPGYGNYTSVDYLHRLLHCSIVYYDLHVHQSGALSLAVRFNGWKWR